MKKFTRKHVLLASLSLVAVSGEAWAVEEQPCHLVMNGLPSTCRIKCRLVETEGLSLWSPEGDLSSCLRVDDHINVPGTTDNWELSNANVMNALLPMLNLYSTYARSQWNSNTQPLTNAKSSTSEVDGPKCPMIGSQELKKIKLLPNGDVEHASEASSLLKGLNTDVANVTFKAKIPANEVKDCPAIRDALRKAVEKQCEAKPAAASAATGGRRFQKLKAGSAGSWAIRVYRRCLER
jgi:hypothetical protein